MRREPAGADPLVGRQLANYRVDRVLGRGGMAQVYYGWDVKLNRPVALKVIDARYRGDPMYARRFVQEAQAVAGWRQENIVQIYYADDQDGLYYYAMEFIDGQDLARLLAAYAADRELMPLPDVLRIGRAIAAALDYAHRRGVIHRDVKPSNVMVARDGRVVLGDFGLALDVEQGSLGEAFGSPHYMAPEQARRSTDAVPQSDLYALGVILYEMLTGAVPFDDPSPTTVALQHLTLPPPPPRSLNPNLSPAAEGVLLKALSKAPAERYPTGQALMQALEAALTEPTAATTPVGAVARPVSHLPVDDRVAQAPPMLAARAPASPRPTPPTHPRAEPQRGPVPPAAPARPAGRRPTPVLVGGVVGLGLAGLLCLALALAPERFGLGGGGAPPSATVRYPNGRPMALFYNPNSFDLLNLSRTDSDVEPLAFERLDAAGNPAGRFDGARWAEFYPTLPPGACMRIEVLDSPPYLEPAECFQGYLSTRTPVRDDPAVFWTPAEDSGQFRVLWADEEIGRCDTAAGLCRVFLPP
jgi:tRNA A-37 threonylcarbamoyl transferase component Bud32